MASFDYPYGRNGIPRSEHTARELGPDVKNSTRSTTPPTSVTTATTPQPPPATITTTTTKKKTETAGAFGRGGALVESMTLNQRVVGSTPDLAVA